MPGLATVVLSYYGYIVGFLYTRLGYASSLAMVNAALIMVICLVYIRLLPREE